MKISVVLPALLFVLLTVGIVFTILDTPDKVARKTSIPELASLKQEPENKYWQKPDDSTIPDGDAGELIRYGKDLIARTAEFLGPKGSVMQISNGLNCQNCHLDAGTKVWGNNYFAVFSTYPKFRDRSGNIESAAKRVNDCMERSLNGKALDTAGKEMKAVLAYMEWLGSGVPKGEKPQGSGITELAYLDRAANPEYGKRVYTEKCSSCHQPDGEGITNAEGNGYVYPPLWGKNSYNDGAGLYRLSRFAGYVKSNMPLGASHDQTMLSDEEAWDVAAYVNSQVRPKLDIKGDWPDIKKKPIDHPFGPYADGFNEHQHKYGPFLPIVEKRKKVTP